MAATGITYNTFGDSLSLVIDRYEDGSFVDAAVNGFTQLTTLKETQAVPESSTVVGLGLLGLGLLGSKKKSKV
ncbi:MAG: PEP-CTERM sorting domain-containing protein [Crocosphaera sp.]